MIRSRLPTFHPLPAAGRGGSTRTDRNWYGPVKFNLNLLKLPVKYPISPIVVVPSGGNKGDQPSYRPTERRLDVNLAERSGTNGPIAPDVLLIDSREAELIGRT